MKNIYYNSLSILIFAFLIGNIPFAQAASSTINGKVIDAETNAPLSMVNIFFINTTIGSASDEDGKFAIENIPIGSYDLLISHVGYAMQSYPLQFMEPDSKYIEIKLIPIVYETDEVKVEASEPRDWKENLKLFTKLFLGKTENTKKCKILNPEVLSFNKTTDPEGFIAKADDIIKVENNALGFKLDIILNYFKYNELIDATQYTIFPRFHKMDPKNDKEAKKWQENRIKCYEGSLKHFISSLSRGNLRNDRFEVYHTMNQRLKGYKVSLQEKEFLEADSSGLKIFKFDNYLSVYHKPGKDIIYDTWIDAAYKETEKSFLKLNTPYVLVDDYGNIFGNFPISVYGEWAKLGIADLLPLDLVPELN